MDFNLEELSKKIEKIQNLSKNDKNYNHLVEKLSDIDDDEIINETIYESIEDGKKDYYLKKKKYKSFILQYSKSYREMAEWYCGEELSYKDYCKIFKKNETYLDSKEDIIELYKLFLFYGMIEQFFI